MTKQRREKTELERIFGPIILNKEMAIAKIKQEIGLYRRVIDQTAEKRDVMKYVESIRRQAIMALMHIARAEKIPLSDYLDHLMVEMKEGGDEEAV